MHSLFPDEARPADDEAPVGSELDRRSVPHDLWHWDGDPAGEGLLLISFFSEVRPGGGGTQIVSGSHRLIADFYASLSPEERALPHKVHRKRLLSADPWLVELSSHSEPSDPERVARFMDRTTEVRGVSCRVVELTGSPGDLVLCNLGMLHAPAANNSDEPRFMRVKFLFLDERDNAGTRP